MTSSNNGNLIIDSAEIADLKFTSAIADQSKSSPINRKSLIAEFFEEIKFCLPQCRAFVVAINEMLVHPFGETYMLYYIRVDEGATRR